MGRGEWEENDGKKADDSRTSEGGESAEDGDSSRSAFFDGFPQIGNQARRARTQNAEFGRPGVGVDGGEGGGEPDPRPRLVWEEPTQGGEGGGDSAVAEDLSRIAFMSLRKFFVESLLALLEGAAQRRGGDEKRQQENRPFPAAGPENDCPHEDGDKRPACVERMGAVGEGGDDDCEDKTEEELHVLWVESQRSNAVERLTFDFSPF